MANRKLQILPKKIYKDGNIDTIYFKNRAKDVIVDENGNVMLDSVLERLNRVANGATKTAKSESNGYLKINDTDTLVYEHPKTGVTAGTYNEVVVDDKGHVVSGHHNTNWSGTVTGNVFDAVISNNNNPSWNTGTTEQLLNIQDGWSVGNILKVIVGILKKLGPVAFKSSITRADLQQGLQNELNNHISTGDVKDSLVLADYSIPSNRKRVASMYIVAFVERRLNELEGTVRQLERRLSSSDATLEYCKNRINKMGYARFDNVNHRIQLTSTFGEFWTENGLQAGVYVVTCVINAINVSYNCFYNFDLCINDENNEFASACGLSAVYSMCTRTIVTLTGVASVPEGGRIYSKGNSSNEVTDPIRKGIIIENIWYSIYRVG